MSILALILSSSPAIWLAEPSPPEAKLNWPGRDFASAISSASDRAGNDGCTDKTLGTRVASTIGVKSVMKS